MSQPITFKATHECDEVWVVRCIDSECVSQHQPEGEVVGNLRFFGDTAQVQAETFAGVLDQYVLLGGMRGREVVRGVESVLSTTGKPPLHCGSDEGA